MQDCDYQWKMPFNLYFNNVTIVTATSQKLLGFNLDAKLTFNINKSEEIFKVIRHAGLLRKLQCFLPRSSLPTIDKSFIKRLDYRDVISVQYNRISSI